MFKRNYLLILVTGIFVFASTASAQSCGCQQSGAASQSPQKGAEAPQQHEKPSTAVEPSRSIAPRNLPAVYEKEAKRAADAAEVLAEFPRQGQIQDAKAIAVFPNVTKAALIWGGRWGKGLLTKRGSDGRWLPPSYIDIGGGNFGFQLGIQSTDLVLIFTNEGAIDALLKGKLTFNADASAAAGPVGRTAQAGVPLLANSGILSFMSRSKGLFAGVSLDGAAIMVDDTANERVYGKYITGDQILLDQRVEANSAVAPFLNALEKMSPGDTTASAQGAGNVEPAAADTESDATQP